MQVQTSIPSVRQALAVSRGPATRLALIPTMGALHAGHLSLIARARSECTFIAASIFVNPLQFGPAEDFARYPRPIEQDIALLASAGVDLLFAPTATEIYPPGASTVVDPGPLGDRLDGAHRSGHFRGVATVVAKLFHILDPDRAYFGQKDAAQVAVLRHMVRDLHLRTQLIACPTLRDPDGLALSSRNAYLSPSERGHALAIPRALQAIRQALSQGITAREPLLTQGRAILSQTPALTLEYLDLTDPDTLEPLAHAVPGALVALAAQAGATRLIDNFLV